MRIDQQPSSAFLTRPTETNKIVPTSQIFLSYILSKPVQNRVSLNKRRTGRGERDVFRVKVPSRKQYIRELNHPIRLTYWKIGRKVYPIIKNEMVFSDKHLSQHEMSKWITRDCSTMSIYFIIVRSQKDILAASLISKHIVQGCRQPYFDDRRAWKCPCRIGKYII